MPHSKWYKPEDKTPELIPVDRDTNVANSTEVICYNIEYDEYWIDSYRRGGCGDDSTLWWGNERIPDCWSYIPAL